MYCPETTDFFFFLVDFYLGCSIECKFATLFFERILFSFVFSCRLVDAKSLFFAISLFLLNYPTSLSYLFTAKKSFSFLTVIIPNKTLTPITTKQSIVKNYMPIPANFFS